MNPLITAGELSVALSAPDVRVFDASWRLGGPNMRAPSEAAHIPGAQFFDLDAVCDPVSPLPHMLPSPEDFARTAGLLGVSETDRIVVYDDGAFHSAPRVWWTFRVMGAARVQVLDGGLPAWKAAGGQTESAFALPDQASFTPDFRGELVRGFDDVMALVRDGGAQIVDARPADRFTGAAAEPRAGLRGGHMPGALCLPVGELYGPGGKMKSPERLREAFAAAGVDPARPVVTTCGSGVAASAVTLALAVLGREDAAVYDGSWSEWGAREDAPVETGAA